MNRQRAPAKSLYAITPTPSHPNINPVVAENWFVGQRPDVLPLLPQYFDEPADVERD